MRICLTMAAVLGLLAGCGTDTGDSSGGAGPAPAQPVDAQATVSPAGGRDYLEQLHAESLYAGVTPAEPGTAYIRVAGRRIDFATVNCTGRQGPGGETFNATASDDGDEAGHMLYMVRNIGPSVSWAWEDEHVQLALLTTPAGEGQARNRYSNSLAQHNREQGADPVWSTGAGQSPLVRIVGEQATATGTLAGMLYAETPLEGDFVAALTCPEAS